MPFFEEEKNITPKMDYTSRTNLHFDIGLGKYMHEIFVSLAHQVALAEDQMAWRQKWYDGRIWNQQGSLNF